MQHWDRHFGDDRADNSSFSEGAVSALSSRQIPVQMMETSALQQSTTHLAEREEHTLEESSRLVHSLLDSHVSVHVELLVLFDLFSDVRQKHVSVKPLTGFGVEVGSENLGRGIDGVGSPLVGLGELENRRPCRNGRKDLESFGQRSRLVSREQLPDPVLPVSVRFAR